MVKKKEMIVGIGVDVVEIARITPLNIRLVHKVLSEKELLIFDTLSNEKQKIEFFGGRFAAKEAYSKALGTGIGKLKFTDIHVLKNTSGAPVLTCKLVENKKVHVSISHTDATIVAFVIIEDN